MNSFIGLGIVLESNQDVLKEIENGLDLLESYATNVTVTFPKDGDYDDWQTESVDHDFAKMIETLAYRTAYAELTLQFDNQEHDARLEFTNEGDEWVLKLDVDTTHMFGSGSFEDLEHTNGIFTRLIEAFDRVLAHSYIFCDSEAEYVYKTARIHELNMVPYALLKVASQPLKHAAWYLDGQTERGQNH